MATSQLPPRIEETDPSRPSPDPPEEVLVELDPPEEGVVVASVDPDGLVEVAEDWLEEDWPDVPVPRLRLMPPLPTLTPAIGVEMLTDPPELFDPPPTGLGMVTLTPPEVSFTLGSLEVLDLVGSPVLVPELAEGVVPWAAPAVVVPPPEEVVPPLE